MCFEGMKVALVHDYLKEYGGAERVLEALHEMFPQAPIYTAYLDLKGLGQHADRIKKWDIRTSWLQKLPMAGRLISPLRILAPAIFESFDLSDYEVVISSCAIYFAKAVITKPETLHISYIHTPPRYLYGYTTSFNYKKHWWTRMGGEIVNHFLRIWDFETSQRPDILVANSKNVQERIKKFYRRDSTVIYPPVEVEKFGSQLTAQSSKREYFLSVGRLVRGKGIEVIIKACSRLGLPLKVVGTGPLFDELKKLAGPTVEFLGQVMDEVLPKLYAHAQATIVAAEDEDFGIVPVESMAAGTPVIAPRAGGFRETVIERKTGVFYPSTGSTGSPQASSGQVTMDSLMEALRNFNPLKFQFSDCINQAKKFSSERFKKEILDLIKRNSPPF